jgi:hypothetical protein
MFCFSSASGSRKGSQVTRQPPDALTDAWRILVFVAAAASATALWAIVLWFIFAFYWSHQAATAAAVGTIICTVLFAALALRPPTASIAAAGLLLIPLLAIFDVSPSMFFVVALFIFGYIAWVKAEWSGRFAVYLFG